MKTAYVHWCRRSGCTVDPSVLTSLETDWAYIKASNTYSLLPLLLMLREEIEKKEKGEETTDIRSQITTLRLKKPKDTHSHLADSNARVIASLVELCPNLKHLDLSAVGLSGFGAGEIVKAVHSSQSLLTLNLSDNPGISPSLTDGAFAGALRKNSSLEKLDVTNDALGFSAVEKLRKAMKHSHCQHGRHFEILDEGNNVFEEVLNALTHGVGILFSIAASWVLMYHASAEGQTRRTFYASLVYCFCLTLLFTASTLLHAAFMNKRASLVLGLLDHTAIYFLIAGTHLPFCLITLEEHPHGVNLAIAQWVLALVGIVLCLVDSQHPIPYKMPIELTLYLGMGWMMSFVSAFEYLNEGAMNLLALGGMAYTVGVLFFLQEKFHHPIGHAIWHVFVLIGAISHYFAVLLYVVGIEEEVQKCGLVID